MSLHEEKRGEFSLKGVGASPGIAIGKACIVGQKRVKIKRKTLSENKIESEQKRFKDAVENVHAYLDSLINKMPEQIKDHAGILRSHIQLLKDKLLFDNTLNRIEKEKVNAEWALKESLQDVKVLFEQVDDSYLRERIEDVEYVVNRILAELTHSQGLALNTLKEPVVVIAHELSPADTIQLDQEKVLGFATDVGSRTSHAAILARSLGIPAVVGLEDVTDEIAQGELVILDGITGKVIADPDKDTLEKYREKQQCYLRYRLDVIHKSHLPAETLDGLRIQVKANIELLEEIPLVLSNGAEGVGLLRTEYLYLSQKGLPDEDKLFQSYRQIAEKLAPHPVTIRTLDIGGDKFVSNISLDEELNPALGLRAIRLLLREPELFRTQLRAILRASAYGNVRILFPLISGRHEILKAKEMLHRAMQELRNERLAFDPAIKVGIMIEVPTAIMVADSLAKEVDFFSLGTNDLIQYSLAIDRINEHVAHLYEPLHPGVLRMIHMAVEAAHDNRIEAAICGEMAGEPMYVPILVGLGLDEFSMNAIDIPRVKRIIRQITHEECTELAQNVLKASSSHEVREMLMNFLHDRLSSEFDPAFGLKPDFDGGKICPIS